MTLKEEIKKAAEKYCTVESVEIATLEEGVVIVWINGKRFGKYDIGKHEFLSLPFKELLQLSGMNKTQFSAYFEIPYRTIQHWEAETRACPEYLLKLIEYKLRKENFIK